jgi:hypothetical protein
MTAARGGHVMRAYLLRTASVGLLLASTTAFALAQNQQNPGATGQGQGGPGATDQKNPSQPNAAANPGGTPDDRARAQQAVPLETTNNQQPQPVFVNGKLAVDGAPADAQTEPAKFSAKNDAIDKLNQNALTDKQLSAEQRRALYQKLGPGRETTGAGGASDPAYAQVGVFLPRDLALQPLPDEIAKQMPNIAIYRYVRAGNKVLLVEPTNDVVVAVLQG